MLEIYYLWWHVAWHPGISVLPPRSDTFLHPPPLSLRYEDCNLYFQSLDRDSELVVPVQPAETQARSCPCATLSSPPWKSKTGSEILCSHDLFMYLIEQFDFKVPSVKYFVILRRVDYMDGCKNRWFLPFKNSFPGDSRGLFSWGRRYTRQHRNWATDHKHLRGSHIVAT